MWRGEGGEASAGETEERLGEETLKGSREAAMVVVVDIVTRGRLVNVHEAFLT